MMKLLCTLLLFCTITLGFAQKQTSPYLSVSTKDAVIPLMASKTDVQISGAIAHVTITQVYQNHGKIPIEAKYVFPLSTQAAVHKMQMSIGDRIINAKIFEKKEANKVYNTALNEGKRVAKLDQSRPNVFQMNVGNIMPNDEITITINYTEMLEPVHGEYQFVAPAVVGPRFTGESASSEESFNMPYTSKGVADLFDYDLTMSINAGMLIKNVSSSSHKVNVRYPNAKTAEVFLSKSNENPSNRDFIVNYNLRESAIQSGLLLYEHGDENFFTFQMEPSVKASLTDIPSREYVFIVDVSGSMNGYPLEVSKELMRNLLCNLRTTDTFNVQLFASSSTVFNHVPVEANTENIEAAIRFLSEGQGGGGTELLNALQEAYKLPRTNPNSSRSMVVITDGYISVEKEAFELISTNLNSANVFTFGIGSSVNRYLIEGMAKVSNSESFIATNKVDAQKVAKDFKEYIATPLLTQIQIDTQGFDVYEVYPKTVPDVFAARPITIFGKYNGEAKGKILVTGYQGNKQFKQEFKVTKGLLSRKNTALRYLWARKKIEELDDYNTLFNQNVKDRVIALGLKYNLATKYTSFVAVDQSTVNKDGSYKTVKQPLPLPQNVNNSAVGAEAEVKAKTKYTKAFSIHITTSVSKSETRSIRMQFKVLYEKLVAEYLKEHENIRVVFNSQGKVMQVKVLENETWVVDLKMTKAFIKFSTKTMQTKQELELIVNKD